MNPVIPNALSAKKQIKIPVFNAIQMLKEEMKIVLVKTDIMKKKTKQIVLNAQ